LGGLDEEATPPRRFRRTEASIVSKRSQDGEQIVLPRFTVGALPKSAQRCDSTLECAWIEVDEVREQVRVKGSHGSPRSVE